MNDDNRLSKYKSLFSDLPHVQSANIEEANAAVEAAGGWNNVTPAHFASVTEQALDVTPCQIAIGTVVFDVFCLCLGATGLRATANSSVFSAMGQAVGPVLSKLETVIATMASPNASKTDLAWGVFQILKTIYSGGSFGAVWSAFKNSLTWWNAILFGVTGIATIVAFIATDGLAVVAEIVILLGTFGFLVSDIANAVRVCGMQPTTPPSEPNPVPGQLPVPPSVAIKTGNGVNLITFNNNGGIGGPNSGLSTVHTDARTVGAWEKFQLIPLEVANSTFALKTQTGNYVTAVNAGGLRGPDATTAIDTDRTAVGPWESLIFEDQGDGTYAIRSTTGYYLTAVNGGGMGGPNDASCPIHTDATALGSWEVFSFVSL